MIGEGLTPKNAKPVVVGWDDIKNTPAWNEAEDVNSATMSNIGWLIEDSATRIVIATGYDWDDGRWCEFVTFSKRVPEVTALPLERAPERRVPRR